MTYGVLLFLLILGVPIAWIMNGLYIFLIAIFGLPAVGLAQQYGDIAHSLRVIKLEKPTVVDSTKSRSLLKQHGGRVFDTAPMPNVYRGDYAAPMPNAYRGDNCVPMPNVYQANPTERIITLKLDSTDKNTPDSLLLQKLDELRDTLEKQRPKE